MVGTAKMTVVVKVFAITSWANVDAFMDLVVSAFYLLVAHFDQSSIRTFTER